jgi:hypothetical protein
MKLEDNDLIELATDNNYYLLVEDIRFGFQPNRPAIFFPSPRDHWLNQNSDDEGRYWIAKKGNERIFVEVLKKAMSLLDQNKILFKLPESRKEQEE